MNSLSVLTNIESRRLEKKLQELSGKGAIVCFDREEKGYVSAQTATALAQRCLHVAEVFHRKEPLKQGMARGALLSGDTGRTAWNKGLPSKLAYFTVERLLRSGDLVSDGEVIRLAGHTVSLGKDQTELRDSLLKAYEEGALMPPSLKELVEKLEIDAKGATPVLRLLCEEGKLVKIKDGFYYHAPIILSLKERMQTWFADHDNLDPAAFKELTGGLSRKYVIPLLEYFDKERFTIRVGDKRQLRSKNERA